MKYYRFCKTLVCIVACTFFIGRGFSQHSEYDALALFEELRQRDSLIFDLGFNNCDTVQFRNLLSDDFEFYHDQGGLTKSKDLFIQSIPNLCNMNYKAIRVLVDSSLEVFPLFSEGKIYGAIQVGVHEFYGEEEDTPRYLTSTARFTHVWILEDENWKLRRILSYDHAIPEH